MTGYSSKTLLAPKIIFFKDTSFLFINTDAATEILMSWNKKGKLLMGKTGQANHDTPSEFGASSRLLRVNVMRDLTFSDQQKPLHYYRVLSQPYRLDVKTNNLYWGRTNPTNGSFVQRTFGLECASVQFLLSD